MNDKWVWSILNGTATVLDRINEALKYKEKKTPETITLTKEDLNHMKWMSPQQLYAIFGGGKKKTAKLDDSIGAHEKAGLYSQMKWFSPEQLEAIFGKDDE